MSLKLKENVQEKRTIWNVSGTNSPFDDFNNTLGKIIRKLKFNSIYIYKLYL